MLVSLVIPSAPFRYLRDYALLPSFTRSLADLAA